MAGYHAASGEAAFGEFIGAATAGAVTSFILSPARQDLKQKMFDCFVSQKRILADFPLNIERFRVAPRYDFLRAPHVGDLNYESYRWDFDGAKWRDHARHALPSELIA